MRFLALVLCGVACSGDDKTVPTQDTAPLEPTETDSSTVSLVDDVVPIIRRDCGGCHTRTDSPSPYAVRNDVFLERRNDLLGLVGTSIVAGDAAASGFIALLEQSAGAGTGPTLMPPPTAGDAMAADDVAVVSTWIDEGALDN